MSEDPIAIDRMRELRACATAYLSRGYRIVPIPQGSKNPVARDWGKRDWKPEDFRSTDNIGILDGPCDAGNLITIDCDTAEIVKLAPYFLPPTGFIGGRPSRGRAHYRYFGDVALSTKRLQFGNKTDGFRTLVEFRSSEPETLSDGKVRPKKQLQTVVAPSIHHPSGELYELYEVNDPASVNSKALLQCTQRLAAAALVVMHFPPKGRHALAMALGAALLRGGWSEDETYHFIFHTFTVGGSEDPETRADTVKHSVEILAKGERCTGWPTVREILDDKVTNKIIEWLGIEVVSRTFGASIYDYELKSAEAEKTEDTVEPSNYPERHLRSGSLLSAVTVIEQNVADILDGQKLAYNEMFGAATLDGEELTDVAETTVRANIERRIDGGQDKDGNPLGLKISAADVHAALDQVARGRSYHPVRDFLRSLKWDGIPRLALVPKLLGAEDSALNCAIMQRWFIGAVARPISPGCKLDTVLVLVGAQGALKSSFFRSLAGDEWFSDSAIDISGKDAYGTLHRAWVTEWAELESLKRARDATMVKAFLTSAMDTYRPPYARLDIRKPRSGIIVATTNDAEFLSDDSGNRRFWPMTVGQIDLEGISAIRDQLLAEAVALYDAGEQWWLTTEEEQLLQPVHERHAVGDAWETAVLTFAAAPSTGVGLSGKVSEVVDLTTANMLRYALHMEIGSWNRSHEHRVGRIMRLNGWNTKRPNRFSPRVWVKS